MHRRQPYPQGSPHGLRRLDTPAPRLTEPPMTSTCRRRCPTSFGQACQASGGKRRLAGRPVGRGDAVPVKSNRSSSRPPRALGASSERKPAGSRAGRRLVRRSEPLAEPAATDPASTSGGSTPPALASTGDTSRARRARDVEASREVRVCSWLSAGPGFLFGPGRGEHSVALARKSAISQTAAAWRLGFLRGPVPVS